MKRRQSTLLEFSQFGAGSSEKEEGTKRSCAREDDTDHRHGGQLNSIQVDEPHGATTIIVNQYTTPVSRPLDDSSSSSQKQPEFSSPQLASERDKAPSDIAATPAQLPFQPTVNTFPTTLIGSKQRSFNPEWYRSYNWLEYSLERDAIFCYPCRMFNEGKSHGTFTKVGFRDWKHATGKGGMLTSHDKCSTHLAAMVAWSQYKLNTKHHTSIAERMESNRAQVISNNRHYLKALIEVILLCALQEIALRGHRESCEAPNRGNFLEILHLLAAHDSIVQQRLEKGPRNAMYTSAEIQNTLLHIMGEMVRKKVCAEVKDAEFYSILADETKDCSKTEQMAIVVRYVNVKEARMYERFLTFVKASCLDASSLTEYILDTLRKYQLNLESIVSQGYDGASVMSGRYSGVQQRIMEVVPQAIYIHCFAHILNLVLVDCSKNVSYAAEFFAILQSLYVFVSSSKAHVVFIHRQQELHPDKPTRELQRLSDTRWACRSSAVDTMCRTYDALLATLEEIVDGEDSAKAVEAKGLLFQVRSFTFLILLVLFDRVLSCTKALSDFLQSRQCDLAKAADLVAATIETLEEFRSDSSWNHLFGYTQQVAEINKIPITCLQQKRQKRLPQRYEEGFVLESTGSRESLSTGDDYKVNVYFPVLDTFLVELKQRFTSRNMEVMKAVQACSPLSSKFLDADYLKPLTENYSIDHPTLLMEAKLAKRTLTSKLKEMETISDVLLQLQPLKEAFPTLVRLLQIAMTICVSSAQCERCFSALKRIKSYLRSTMTEMRLVDLASLSIEHEIARQLSIEAVVDEFASSDRNRRITLF